MMTKGRRHICCAASSLTGKSEENCLAMNCDGHRIALYRCMIVIIMLFGSVSLSSCLYYYPMSSSNAYLYTARLPAGFYMIEFAYADGDCKVRPTLRPYPPTDQECLHAEGTVSVYVDGKMISHDEPRVFEPSGNKLGLYWDLRSVRLDHAAKVSVSCNGELAKIVSGRRVFCRRALK